MGLILVASSGVFDNDLYIIKEGITMNLKIYLSFVTDKYLALRN